MEKKTICNGEYPHKIECKLCKVKVENIYELEDNGVCENCNMDRKSNLIENIQARKKRVENIQTKTHYINTPNINSRRL